MCVCVFFRSSVVWFLLFCICIVEWFLSVFFFCSVRHHLLSTQTHRRIQLIWLWMFTGSERKRSTFQCKSKNEGKKQQRTRKPLSNRIFCVNIESSSLNIALRRKREATTHRERCASVNVNDNNNDNELKKRKEKQECVLKRRLLFLS